LFVRHASHSGRCVITIFHQNSIRQR
jgi:hypothetical protein